MLPEWKERPEVTANLLNPAFCTEVMRECVSGFTQESGEGLPFSLSILILPLILNNQIRERLPKSKATPIHSWINGNEEFRIHLARQISSFVPFTREAIMFGVAHESLNMTDDGKLETAKRRRRFITNDEEIESCLKKSVILGKLLARSGNPLTIYSLLGIRP